MCVKDLVTGVAVCLGSREFLELKGYAAPLEEHHANVAASVAGPDAIKTFVWVGWSHYIRGCIALSDIVRSDAADIITWLHAQGIDVWMVTGDNETSALAVAAVVDIPRDRVIAHATPSRKLQAVQVSSLAPHLFDSIVSSTPCSRGCKKRVMSWPLWVMVSMTF